MRKFFPRSFFPANNKRRSTNTTFICSFVIIQIFVYQKHAPCGWKYSFPILFTFWKFKAIKVNGILTNCYCSDLNIEETSCLIASESTGGRGLIAQSTPLIKWYVQRKLFSKSPQNSNLSLVHKVQCQLISFLIS